MQPKKEKRKAGRYTKLTPELQQEFIAAIESGLTNKSACDYVGIDESTFYSWLNIARKAELEAAENGTKIPKNIKPFSEFSKSLKKAEARFKAYHCKNIKRAGDEGAWQASAWLLERKFPEEYGKNRCFDTNDTSRADADFIEALSASAKEVWPDEDETE